MNKAITITFSILAIIFIIWLILLTVKASNNKKDIAKLTGVAVAQGNVFTAFIEEFTS